MYALPSSPLAATTFDVTFGGGTLGIGVLLAGIGVLCRLVLSGVLMGLTIKGRAHGSLRTQRQPQTRAIPYYPPENRDELQKRITAIRTTIVQLVSDTIPIHLTRDLSLTRTVDPSVRGDLAFGLTDIDNNEIDTRITIQCGTGDAPAIAPLEEESWDGILSRQPRSLKTIITMQSRNASARTIFNDVISYAQFGDPLVIPVTAARLGSSTTGLEFSPQSGRLTKLTRSTSGAASAIAKTSAAASDALSKEIDALNKRKSPRQMEVDQLNLEATLLEARAKITKLRAAETQKSKPPSA